MDGRAVAAVALRVWGVLLLVGAVTSMPGAVWMARATLVLEQADFIRASQTASFLQLAATAVVGLCLLVWADPIARRAIPETAPPQLGADAPQLLAVVTAGVILVLGRRGFARAWAQLRSLVQTGHGLRTP